MVSAELRRLVRFGLVRDGLLFPVAAVLGLGLGFGFPAVALGTLVASLTVGPLLLNTSEVSPASAAAGVEAGFAAGSNPNLYTASGLRFPGRLEIVAALFGLAVWSAFAFVLAVTVA